MRVGTERSRFGLNVGESRVTLDFHLYVELLLDVDLLLDVHLLLELYSKCFQVGGRAHFVLLLCSCADAVGVATRPQGKPSVAWLKIAKVHREYDLLARVHREYGP